MEPIDVGDLRVDGEREPTNLPPGAPPTFDWTVDGDRGASQSAYRIVVAETRAAAGRHVGAVWDSGVVESSRSVAVRYQGPPLAPDATYYWAALVCDGDGRAAWSDPARFETALAPADWAGAWIGRPTLAWEDATVAATLAVDRGTAGLLVRADESGGYRVELSVDEGEPDGARLRVSAVEDGDARTSSAHSFGTSGITTTAT